MTLLKDNNYKEINVALLSLEADIKKLSNNGGFDTSVIDKQLAEINSRIDKINAGNNNSSAEINDIRTEIENINSKLIGNSAKIESVQKDISALQSEIQDVSNIHIPNPPFPGVSYIIRKDMVQSISKVDGVSIEGKTLQISFRLYEYASSFTVQLSYGTTDGVIQQMSGAGRAWFVEINENDTDYSISGEWKFFNRTVAIPQGNPIFGIGSNVSVCINSIKVV